MSEIRPQITPSTPLVPPPAARAEIEPRGAKALVPGDRATFAANPTAWVAATTPKVEKAGKAELKEIAAQALGHLGTDGLEDATRASLYFLASQAHGRLSDMEDQTGNGKLAYHEIAKAAQLAPRRLDIVGGYAEAVNELVKRGSFTRSFAEGILEVKTSPEAKKAVALLAHFPDDARAQAFRLKFATFLHDATASQAARQALAKMPQEQAAAACRAVDVKL